MDAAGGISLILTALMFLGLFFVVGSIHGESRAMRQAFEGGHAVQCVGKVGYYWECE